LIKYVIKIEIDNRDPAHQPLEIKVTSARA
jgi:hypothetical protein